MAGRDTLNPKQRRFVDEYLQDSNATQAAIRAGYSEKTAQPSSSRMLSNVIVAAEIARRQSVVSERAEITAANHLERLAELARGAVEVKQYAAAITAEHHRGKVSGLYTERIEHSGTIETLAVRRRAVA